MVDVVEKMGLEVQMVELVVLVVLLAVEDLVEEEMEVEVILEELVVMGEVVMDLVSMVKVVGALVVEEMGQVIQEEVEYTEVDLVEVGLEVGLEVVA